METQTVTSLSILKAKIKDIRSDRESIRAPQLTKELIDAYGQEPWFDGLRDELLTRAIYDVVVIELNRKQSIGTVDGRVKAPTAEQIAERYERLRIGVMSGFEWTGSEHRKISLMTKADIIAAAQQREARGMHNLELSKFWYALAQKMNDIEAFSSVASSTDIETLSELIRRDN